MGAQSTTPAHIAPVIAAGISSAVTTRETTSFEAVGLSSKTLAGTNAEALSGLATTHKING